MRNNFAKYPARRETAISGSGTPAEHLQLIRTPVLEGFNSGSSFGVRGSVQSLDTDQLKAAKPAGTPVREISFGPFRLLARTVSSARRRQTSAARQSRSAYTHGVA